MYELSDTEAGLSWAISFAPAVMHRLDKFGICHQAVLKSRQGVQLHAQGCRVAAVGRDAGRLADVQADVRMAADTTTLEGAALTIAACQARLAPRRRCWRTASAAR